MNMPMHVGLALMMTSVVALVVNLLTGVWLFALGWPRPPQFLSIWLASCMTGFVLGAVVYLIGSLSKEE